MLEAGCPADVRTNVMSGERVCISADRRRTGLVMAAMAIVPLAYCLYTGQIWEDYFITFRYSQNLCDGLGPVYNSGERVHGFTSPLGMLLPALAYLATGRSSYPTALWLFRIISVAAFSTGGLFLWRVLRNSARGYFASLTFAVLYIFEAKSVAFSVNGMETGLMLFWLAWALCQIGSDPGRWVPRGLAWAGLMWTRPDGCVYIVALALGELFLSRSGHRSLAASFLKSAVLAGVVYSPWLAWAWWYYGSPIPQTLLAKAPLPAASLVGRFLTMVRRVPERAEAIFAPVYYPFLWNSPRWIGWFCRILALVAGSYWLFPSRDLRARVSSFGFMLLTFYFCYMEVVFPWYPPPVALCGLMVLASIIRQLSQAGQLAWAARPALVMVMATCLYMFIVTAYMMKVQQNEIEWGLRAPIGRWVGEHAREEQSIYLEAIGYIGYFSHAHIVDYPGLISPQVTRLRREKHLTFGSLVDALHPDWTVFRQREVPGVFATSPAFRTEYAPVTGFDASARLASFAWLPGQSFLEFDADYIISKRVVDASARSMSAELQNEAIEYNRPLYLMMRTPPILVRSQVDFGRLMYQEQSVLFVQPEGSATFQVPRGATKVSARFGVIPPRQGNIEAVTFQAEYFPRQGEPRQIFDRQLDPAHVTGDQGLQDLEGDLSGEEGTVVLWTKKGTGPMGGGRPFWSKVQIR
jgi:hypothetical protein